MKELYNIEDAFKILKHKKILNLISIIGSIVIISLVVLITIFYDSTFIMVLDIVLSSILAIYIFTVYRFIFKELNEQYHFLAKIEQFDHIFIDDTVKSIDIDTITLNKMIVEKVEFNNGSIAFIEANKRDDHFILSSRVKAEVVDKVIIAYEVEYDKEQ